MDSNTRARLYEIAFYTIINSIGERVGREKLSYFLEYFCNTFEIDFTSINILVNMYLGKMKPSKRDLALFVEHTGMPHSLTPLDKRTLRKYRKEWQLRGHPPMMPSVFNAFLQPTVKKFVVMYASLMFTEVRYIKNLEIGDNPNELPTSTNA